MKKFALIMFLALLVALPVAAQEKPKTDTTKPAATQEKPKTEMPKSDAKLPTVDEILDKYVKAIGGKEAIEKQNARAIKGTFEIEAMNMTGSFQGYSKAPNKNAMIIEVPGVGTFNEVFDGTKSWSANPMTGLREKTGAELAATKRDADFYGPLNFKKNFAKMEVKGKEKVGASEAYVIVATPATGEGDPEKLYFDATTGLLVRHDAERDSEQGKIAVEIYYEDYKDVNGVKVPHRMRQVTPMFSMTMKFDEIKPNTAIEDAKFNKPSGN